MLTCKNRLRYRQEGALQSVCCERKSDKGHVFLKKYFYPLGKVQYLADRRRRAVAAPHVHAGRFQARPEAERKSGGAKSSVELVGPHGVREAQASTPVKISRSTGSATEWSTSIRGEVDISVCFSTQGRLL